MMLSFSQRDFARYRAPARGWQRDVPDTVWVPVVCGFIGFCLMVGVLT